MNSTSSPVAIDSPTRLQSRGGRLLNALDNFYAKSRPDVPAGGFKDRVFLRLDEILRGRPATLLLADGNLDGEALDRLILEVEGPPIGVDVWFIYASCACALAAIHAVETGDEARAWEMLADANFHLGWAASLSQGEEITDEMMKKRLATARARAAAEARHRKTNEMKTWAYEHVRSQTDWPSQASAVQALEIALKAKFGDNCLKDFEGTVTTWLEDMPDREQHFKTVGTNRLKV